MKKKITLDEAKLARFTAVAGAVIAGSNVNAQIVYQDINPDVVVNIANPNYALDFNNDAAPDVAFQISQVNGSTTYSGIPITYQGTYGAANAPGGGLQNVQIQTGSASSQLASYIGALNNGDEVSSAEMFSSYGLLAGDITITIPLLGQTLNYPLGEWLGVTDKFLGVKFTAGANTHYGWVRMDVSAGADVITIKDYAFNATPNAPINAGQMVSLDGITMEDKVTVRSLLDEAMINVTPDLIGAQLSLVSLTGQVVASQSIEDVHNVLSYAGLETGVYMITVQAADETVNKKVYVR
jgi:hypothetical protein